MVKKIAVSALIAALYAGLTAALAPISYGLVQFRVAEALTLLPFFLPEAIPGLFIGCLLSNLLGGFGLIDVVLGSSATFAAAWLTYKAPNLWLAAVPPVAINAVVVGAYVGVLTGTPLLLSILYIGASQAVVCFVLGVPLCRLLSRSPLLSAWFADGKRKNDGGAN